MKVAMTTDPAALRGWCQRVVEVRAQKQEALAVQVGRLLTYNRSRGASDSGNAWHWSASSATTTSIWTAGDTVTPQPSELEAGDKIELTDLVSLETAATGSQVITPVSHFYKAIFLWGRKVHL